jgi:hypothetical protein
MILEIKLINRYILSPFKSIIKEEQIQLECGYFMMQTSKFSSMMAMDTLKNYQLNFMQTYILYWS